MFQCAECGLSLQSKESWEAHLAAHETVYRHQRPDNISRRDWFAGMAMQAIMVGNSKIDPSPYTIAQVIASSAVLAADALIAELDKT